MPFARFEGQGLKPLDPTDVELKYRKYALPEELHVDETQPTQRVQMDIGRLPSSADRLSASTARMLPIWSRRK